MRFPRTGEVVTDSRGNRYRVVTCETSARLGFLAPVISIVPATPDLEKKLSRMMPLLPDDPDGAEDAEPG